MANLPQVWETFEIMQKNVAAMATLVQSEGYQEIFPRNSEWASTHLEVLNRFQSDCHVLENIIADNTRTQEAQLHQFTKINFRTTPNFLSDQIGDIVPSDYYTTYPNNQVLTNLTHYYWAIRAKYTNLQNLQKTILDQKRRATEEKRVTLERRAVEADELEAQNAQLVEQVTQWTKAMEDMLQGSLVGVMVRSPVALSAAPSSSRKRGPSSSAQVLEQGTGHYHVPKAARQGE